MVDRVSLVAMEERRVANERVEGLDTPADNRGVRVSRRTRE